MAITMELTSKNQSLKKLHGKNTRSFLILDSAKNVTLEAVINGYFNQSAHYFIDIQWGLHKIGNDMDVIPHCGTSNWMTYENMDNMAIWIMLQWETFSDEQKETLKRLSRELTRECWIPEQNILRKKDITQNDGKWIKAELFVEWGDSRRKGISDSIREWFESFAEYRKTLHHSCRDTVAIKNKIKRVEKPKIVDKFAVLERAWVIEYNEDGTIDIINVIYNLYSMMR